MDVCISSIVEVLKSAVGLSRAGKIAEIVALLLSADARTLEIVRKVVVSLVAA